MQLGEQLEEQLEVPLKVVRAVDWLAGHFVAVHLQDQDSDFQHQWVAKLDLKYWSTLRVDHLSLPVVGRLLLLAVGQLLLLAVELHLLQEVHLGEKSVLKYFTCEQSLSNIPSKPPLEPPPGCGLPLRRPPVKLNQHWSISQWVLGL